jgi:uncharacterized membrane protein YcaP (DUF421 family)
MLDVNWSEMLTPDANTLEVVLRASVVYLAIFLLMRFVLRREVGGLGTADVLVLVLIADGAQNAMSIDYKSVPTGIALVSTIVLWDAGLDWLAYRVPWFAALLHPAPLPLVIDGQMQWRRMRRELISPSELQAAFREQGIEDVADVKSAQLEGDGRISVIPREGAGGQQRPPEAAPR